MFKDLTSNSLECPWYVNITEGAPTYAGVVKGLSPRPSEWTRQPAPDFWDRGIVVRGQR